MEDIFGQNKSIRLNPIEKSEEIVDVLTDLSIKVVQVDQNRSPQSTKLIQMGYYRKMNQVYQFLLMILPDH